MSPCEVGSLQLTEIWHHDLPLFDTSCHPQNAPKFHCLNIAISESQNNPKQCLIIISFCPYYLKQSIHCSIYIVFSPDYKVTSASETDVYARILCRSLMLFRLTSNYLTH